MTVSASARHTSAPFAPRDRFALSPAGIMVICAFGLAILGLTILFSASVTKNPETYLLKQAAGLCLAIAAAVVTSHINIEFLRRYAWWIGGIAALILTIILIPGIGATVNGSQRWLILGPLRFQVSEIGKIAMVFCLAHYLATNQSRIGEFKRGFIYPLLIVATFTGLIAKEPDIGTAALTGAVGFTLLFLSGARFLYLIPAILAGLGGISALIYFMPNRLGRITEYIKYIFYNEPPPYQLKQSLLAFAAGGASGAGLGQGRQQMNFLPEAHTDFIFSVIGEELGIFFTLGVVVIFLTMCVAGFLHLRRAPNLFQFLLVSGCLLIINLQAIINLGVVTGLLPTKGMSLPFISAGMSNLLLMGILLGIIINTQRTWNRTRIDPSNTEWKDAA